MLRAQPQVRLLILWASKRHLPVFLLQLVDACRRVRPLPKRLRSLTLVLLHPDEHLMDVGGIDLEVGIDVLLEFDLLRR